MNDHTSPPAEDSRLVKVLVLFLGATNAYDVFFASGVDLYLKLGIVASAVGFMLSRRYRTFAFVMMIAFYLASFVLRRFVLDVGA